MPYVDSVDKIIQSYVSAVTAEPFDYKGNRYFPKLLVVSPDLFRGYTCPAGCGGCCHIRFSLDYLPSDELPYEMDWRYVTVNRKRFRIYSDLQEDRKTERACRNLRARDGRCGIHGKHPFSCDFELIRPLHYHDHVRLTSKLFGRGWNMLRVDGERGALCEMLPPTRETISEVRRKLERLEQWCQHFQIATRIPNILEWVETAPHIEPLVLRN
jgi:hypothetical protein